MFSFWPIKGKDTHFPAPVSGGTRDAHGGRPEVKMAFPGLNKETPLLPQSLKVGLFLLKKRALRLSTIQRGGILY